MISSRYVSGIIYRYVGYSGEQRQVPILLELLSAGGVPKAPYKHICAYFMCCMHICAHACLWACTCVCSISTNACVLSMRTCVHAHVHKCACLFACVHM